MSETDWEYEAERLDKYAISRLVANHEDEYRQLRRDILGERIEEMERRLTALTETVRRLKELNPDGINVPSLTRTANLLAEENDELTAELRQLRRGSE